MRKYLYLIYDLACICGALVAALYLRHGFPLIQEGRAGDIYLLLLVTVIVAVFVFSVMQTHKGIWRFTSAADLPPIMIAVALVVLFSNGGLFLISRLEMMPRSVPLMHWVIAVVAMYSSRLMARRLFGEPENTLKNNSMLQHVIIVGVSHTAELYLEFIKRIVQHHVVVEGFVDSNNQLTNRLFHKYKILGAPEDLPTILERLNVHGIHVKHIVLTQLLGDLPKATQEILTTLESSGGIELIHFKKYIAPRLQARMKRDKADFYQNMSVIAETAYEKPRGIYPYIKRAFDIFFGVVLLILLSPILLITALLVLIDVGLPLLFWQKRPGQYGKPFQLYKFRTMRAAGRKLDEDRLAHKLGDKARTSVIGKWIRNLRLDELPQLFHIIAGTMSFVGPRPLLPEDQPKDGEIRLSVRPGATGWAQIHGGDALNPKEKLVLDTWYIRNISLWLDLRIMLRTLLVVLKEDETQRERHGQI